MPAPKDWLDYYDLETFLFSEVHQRFREQGWLDAFDLLSIVIWKANRAKSRIARRLLATSGCSTLDEAARRLTGRIHEAGTARDRLAVLIDEWGFLLPMASAILSVLYPDEFTVYDYRVCKELKAFEKLGERTTIQQIWPDYEAYMQRVRASRSELSLRDCDRLLTGQSMGEQLERNIQEWEEKPAQAAPPTSPAGS